MTTAVTGFMGGSRNIEPPSEDSTDRPRSVATSYSGGRGYDAAIAVVGC